MESKYDGKCKDCSITWKVGAEINKNKNNNWCSKGDNCTKSGATIVSEPTIDEVKWNKNPIDLANIDLPHDIKQKILTVTKEANKVLKVIEWQAWEDLGFNTSPARVGMYVNNIAKKLLYVPIVLTETPEDEDESKS